MLSTTISSALGGTDVTHRQTDSRRRDAQPDGQTDSRKVKMKGLAEVARGRSWREKRSHS